MAVYYRMRRWYDHWFVLFRWKGSVLPRAMLSIMSAVLFNLFHHQVLIPYRYPTGHTFLHNPVGFTFFMQTAAFILAFTTGICYNRFWEALGHLYTMSNHMGVAASLALASAHIDSADVHPDWLKWRTMFLHDISVLHATCIQSLYTENIKTPLDILGGLTDWEISELEGVKDQSALVFHWVHCSVANRLSSGDAQLPATIVSQLWTQLTGAMSAYNNALKLSKVPLPLSFQQSLAWADLIVLTFTPFCIAAFTPDLYLSLALTFVTALIYHGAYLADISMQQPFGEKSTDLPLAGVHRDFTSKLLSFITEDVAEELNRFFDSDHADQSAVPVSRAPRVKAIRPIEMYNPRGLPPKVASEPLQVSRVPLTPSTSTEAADLRAPVSVRNSIQGTRHLQLQTYRSTLLGETFPISQPESKRGSIMSRSGARLSLAKPNPEGVFYGNKLLAKEVVIPDQKRNSDEDNKVAILLTGGDGVSIPRSSKTRRDTALDPDIFVDRI